MIRSPAGNRISYLLTSIFFLSLGLLVLPAQLFSQEELGAAVRSYAPDEEVPISSEALTGTFKNGLRYYILENGRPENRAVLRLAVKAGSILETEEQQGIAHFLEHMAFNGTKNFQENEIINYLESIGMNFGPDINAYTSFDETVYMLTVPTDDQEVLETAFQILRDWAVHITLDPEQVESEKGVVIEEWRLGLGPQQRLREQYFPTLLYDSRYADRLPIGEQETIEDFTPVMVREFYETWYRPELMAVVAVGDFNQEVVLQMLENYFSGLENPENAPERPAFPVPDHEETLFEVATDPEATSAFSQIFYKYDPVRKETVADLVDEMKRELILTMINRRFSERARQEDPPYIVAQAGRMNITPEKSLLGLYSRVQSDGISEGMTALLEEAVRTERYGFLESELTFGKNVILTRVEQEYTRRSTMTSSEWASRFLDHYLYDEPVPGPEYRYGVYSQYLPQISLEEVNETADWWIRQNNRVFLVTAPEREGVPVPDEQELQQLVASFSRSSVRPPQEISIPDRLVAEAPEGGSIVSERSFPSVGVTELTLSNGAKLVLKPTDFTAGEVLLEAYSPGGTSAVEQNAFLSAQFAAEIAWESGAGAYSRTELQTVLSDKTASVRPYIGTLTEGFSGSSSTEDLQTLFELMYLYFNEPRFDRAAYRSLIGRLRSLVANREQNPQLVFRDTLQEALYQEHYRRLPLSTERVGEIAFDEAERIFRERFSGAGDFTFVLVGDFSPAEARSFAETYLAGLSEGNAGEDWQDRGIEYPEDVVKEVVRMGLEPQSLVALVFNGPFFWSRENVYILSSLAEVLRIRLREQLREQAGGTYGVRVSTTPARYPDEDYRIDISFGTNPERVNELVELIFQEISLRKNEPPADTYLQRVKEIQLSAYEEDLRENSYWLRSLRDAWFYDLEPDYVLAYDDMVSGLNGEDIMAAARAYLETDRYVQVVLYPEDSEEELAAVSLTGTAGTGSNGR